MKTKLLVAVLLMVCFTLAGALYATAAPSSSPELRALRVKVENMEGRLILAELRVKQLRCQTDYVWNNARRLYLREMQREAFPDLQQDKLTFPEAGILLPACVS